MLKAGLRNRAVNVPQDFAQGLLTRIQREEYAAALARIKRSERLLVAAMVTVPVIAALIFLLVGPQIIGQVNTLLTDARDLLGTYTINTALHFKYWAGIAGMAAILLYALFDLIFAEN